MRKHASFYLTNGVLLFGYLYFYFDTLHLMHLELRRWPEDVDASDSITYVTTVYPVLAAVVILNLGWFSAECVRTLRSRPIKWTFGLAPLAVGLVWTIIHCTRGIWTPLLWRVA